MDNKRKINKKERMLTSEEMDNKRKEK